MPSSSYEQIASEYYDRRHLTSRNFDHTTSVALAANPFDVPDGVVLEIGAGRGRAGEFLKFPPSRIVQLDNSDAMFNLETREECLLKVLADACCIPLIPQQFSAVVGFLVDPFMGLNCLGEAFRMLSDGGRLLFTVPTKTWGSVLREPLGIDVMTTRFEILGTGETILLPSLLHSPNQIKEMLGLTGFDNIEILDHCLPEGESPVSPDILSVCEAMKVDCFDLPVIHSIRAQR